MTNGLPKNERLSVLAYTLVKDYNIEPSKVNLKCTHDL